MKQGCSKIFMAIKTIYSKEPILQYYSALALNMAWDAAYECTCIHIKQTRVENYKLKYFVIT